MAVGKVGVVTGRVIRIKIRDSPHQEERGLQPESSLHQEERGLQPEKGTLDAAQKTPRVSVALAFERECGLQPETRAPAERRSSSGVRQHWLCVQTFAKRIIQTFHPALASELG